MKSKIAQKTTVDDSIKFNDLNSTEKINRPVDMNSSESNIADKVSSDFSTDDNSSGVMVREIEVEKNASLFARSIAPVIIGIIIGVLTAFCVITYYKSQNSSLSPTPSVTPTVVLAPSITPDKSASSAANLTSDLTFYDIKVLNGSGIPGEAGKVEKLLKDKGYSVLETGNAASYDYEDTVVQAKEKVPAAFVDSLTDFLNKTYSVAEKEVYTGGSSVDIIIIVGSKKAPSQP